MDVDHRDPDSFEEAGAQDLHVPRKYDDVDLAQQLQKARLALRLRFLGDRHVVVRQSEGFNVADQVQVIGGDDGHPPSSSPRRQRQSRSSRQCS